ncbi:hypothetical protein HDE79_004350 [Rhodanobacter sp. MP1X3]|nr:hypothetical protein [Rhodanobacter sp. MP1X3]
MMCQYQIKMLEKRRAGKGVRDNLSQVPLLANRVWLTGQNPFLNVSNQNDFGKKRIDAK